MEVNPLVQTISPNIALLHIARSMPFVDDSRVLIGGGSAGGYATLMLAAEATVGHYKHSTIQVTRKKFLEGVLTGKVPASQLLL